MSAALCFTPWYEPIGLPNAMRIFAYSVVMSRTFCAPPHISAQSATVARSITRASGGQPPPLGPSTASAPTVAALRLTSHSFRRASLGGRRLHVIPLEAFVREHRLDAP